MYGGVGVVHDMEEAIDCFVEVVGCDFLYELFCFGSALVVWGEEYFYDRV